MDKLDLVVSEWKDYILIDSGYNRKLERFGSFILIRPETQAIWKPKKPEWWGKADAEFRFVDGKGEWLKKKIPDSWQMNWQSIKFLVKPTNFKHIGVFPEQAANWHWLGERVGSIGQPEVLNLFGYTGISSIVAAEKGARVTHVDASRQSNIWAQNNARLSEISQTDIRYFLDDALKFCERELRRGSVYDGIVLDPPAFGRGAKGEVWKIENNLIKLLEITSRLLNKKSNSFLLVNGYAAGYSSYSLWQAVQNFFPCQKGEFGELSIAESDSSRRIPSGVYVRLII